jgi:hypothetical protein
MSDIKPAQATPILSVTLNTFFPALLKTKVPQATLRSLARTTPSLQTIPKVVAPKGISIPPWDELGKLVMIKSSQGETIMWNDI